MSYKLDKGSGSNYCIPGDSSSRGAYTTSRNLEKISGYDPLGKGFSSDYDHNPTNKFTMNLYL